MKRYRIYLSPPHIEGKERELVKEAFDSNFIAPAGPMIDMFEREFSEYTGIRHCLAVSSGTAAMHLAIKECGVKRGDFVICPTFTFIATVSPAVYEGAVPVFIDSDKKTWTIDCDLLAETLERMKKERRIPSAVVTVDLYGQTCDMDRIIEICTYYNIPVVSDSAEAVGSLYKGRHAGKGADFVVFSFNGNKILTTSGGGMLASDNESLISHARKLANQARENVPHYEHVEIGYNYRMSNICAAIGRGQLSVIDKRVEQKRQIFEMYKERLKCIEYVEFMPEACYCRSNRWLTVILFSIKDGFSMREKVRAALEEAGIESRPVWKPMHIQPVFKGNECVDRGIAASIFMTGLCLPSGTALTESEIDEICDIIKRCCLR